MARWGGGGGDGNGGFNGLDRLDWTVGRNWSDDITDPTLRIGDIPMRGISAVGYAYVGVDFTNLSRRRQPKMVIISSTKTQM